jgi:alanyl-tRNA synthetase
MEIWNDVFMEFNKNAEGKYEKMAQQNVDTGMGLERTVTVLSGEQNVFNTDLFLPIIKKIEELSGKKYGDSEEVKKSMRIIADHIKASVFIIADGVEPSNVQRGYVLRRLIRRAIRQGHLLGIENNFTADIAKVVQGMYGEAYPEIVDEKIIDALTEEEEKFRKTLLKGLRELTIKFQNEDVTGQAAFDLFQTYGFPQEMTKEIAQENNFKIAPDFDKQFSEKLGKHQELSRTASAGMFKGGLADTQEKTRQLHTATHLMLAGLRKVLGDHIHQKGSNINGERARFDFSHPDKMTDDQKKAVEDFVNEAIGAKVDVTMTEMTLDEAKEAGAEGAFEHKYGDRVKVYEVIGFSKEICGGPHVENTAEIKGTFRIAKEESSSAGVRRIKAVLE